MSNAINRGVKQRRQELVSAGKSKRWPAKSSVIRRCKPTARPKVSLKGQAKQEAAKASERVKGKVEEIAGAVKNRVGAVIDNEQMQTEGKAKELKGEARQKANR